MISNKPTGCDVLGRMNATHGLYEQARVEKDTYNTIFSYLGEPKEQHHIISIGFVEGSGPYKKVMDMYDEYIVRGLLPPIIVITKKIWDKKEKIRNFFNSRNATIYFVDDTSRDYNQPIEDSYRAIDSVFAKIVANHQIQGCVSQGRQTFFPFACKKNSIPCVMMHGSGPDHFICNELDENGYPNNLFHYDSYKSVKAYLITALLSPTQRIDEHFVECNLENETEFLPVFQPYKTEFQGRIREALLISPNRCRQYIQDNNIFINYSANTPLVYVSRSGTLFDNKELTNPDSLFSIEQLQQAEDRLVNVLNVLENIGYIHKTNIAVYIDQEARDLIELKYKNKRSNIDLLVPSAAYIKDEDYLPLRKGGVEISRAAQSGATTIGYGVGGVPIILTVPHEDKEKELPDYMFETASEKLFADAGCPVISTDADIEKQLYDKLLVMLKYKNSNIQWFSFDQSTSMF